MKKLSLQKKLILAFTLISSLLLIVGAVSIIFQTKIISNYDHIVNVNLPNAVTLGDMNQDLSVMTKTLLEMSLNQTDANFLKDSKEMVGIKIENFENLKKQYEEMKSFAVGEEEVYAPIKDNWESLKGKILEQSNNLSENNPEKLKVFHQEYNKDLGPMLKDFSENLNFVLDFQKASASENVENALSLKEQGLWIVVISIIVGVFFSLTFGILFSARLSKNLREFAHRLSEIVEKINGTSEKMASFSTALSKNVEVEAIALEKTSSSTEELNSMVKRNEDNTVHSQEISNQSLNTALEGQKAVEAMIESMHTIEKSNTEILNSIEKSNKNISEINNYIKSIGDKTLVINDIVFQTKLLSFNASVEAARAGEHGKGFAVVAEEVGNLAEMSGKASNEISKMLSESIQNVEEIIQSSRREVDQKIMYSKQCLEDGNKTAKVCHDVLNRVVENVNKVNTILSEISHASKEQTIGLSEINKAIHDLDTNTHSTTQTAKQTENSSYSLSSDAHVLQEIATKLIENVEGVKH